jgi:GDPmannose 4,6-dehydratase
MSHVGSSFESPSATFQVNTIGVLNALEGIRHFSKRTKFYQASTSEMFGSNYKEVLVGDKLVRFQNDSTELSPNSPYSVSKVAAHQLVSLYRRSYNLHASCGKLFNHESPRRGCEFLTKKITLYIARLYNAINDGKKIPKLKLGNLKSHRDWGHAVDYVYAMWLMLQQDKPDDYVIATGDTHSCEEFLTEAFSNIGIYDWTPYVEIDKNLFRACEVEYLCGHADKAKKVLGWESKITFKELVKEMVDYDIAQLS